MLSLTGFSNFGINCYDPGGRLLRHKKTTNAGSGWNVSYLRRSISPYRWIFASALLPRFLVSAVILFGAAIGCSSPSNAYVNQIIIDSTNTANYDPIPLGSSTPGSAISYTIYTGRIVGMLSPTQPLNSVITDINLAPTTGGLVSYTANFSIITPTNPALRSGLMIHVVPNRGGNGINTNALIAGATYVQSGWQGDLLSQCSTPPVPAYPCVSLGSPYGTASASYPFFTPPNGLADFVVQVPVATTDGHSPNGTNTITGPVYGHVCIGPNGCPLASGSVTSTSHLAIQGPAFVPYQPVSTDTNQAQLWTVPSQSFAGVDGPKTVIPSADWAWAYCPSGWPGTPDPNYICLNGATFNPNLLYEVVYTAANPLVLGVGFTAFRDLASFLRYGTTAPGGGSNPIAGTVTTAMTMGSSQSGAFIHGFIFYGFNEDEDGRIVFDGAWPQVDGRMMVMNIRWGQPNNLMYLYMGGDEAPVWWADYPNMARNLPADGMLHRCTATGTCPQILETFGSAELYSEKMSVGLCGFTCVADIPLPSNVYRYYTPGATHGGGTVSFIWSAPGSITPPAGQTYPTDPIPETYTNNALQADFINWLMNGIAMPPSVYPTLARGELVVNTASAEGFPTIPGFPFAGNQAWPPFVYDFGPGENYDQESGIPTTQPPNITQVLPVYATKVNADGNENVTGLPSVLGQAPLGTYVGWNLTSTGWYTGQVIPGAGGSGSFWPFWDTKANRIANGDPRLSLEERYGTSAGYNCVVTQALNAAVAQRFLLLSDATTLSSLAAGSNVLAPPFTPTAADTALANALCGDAAIAVSASPAAGGSVSGGGTFAVGSSQTVMATANAGYVFTDWTVESAAATALQRPRLPSVVSTSASYAFTLNANVSLVAHFVLNNNRIIAAAPPAGVTASGGGTFVDVAAPAGPAPTVTAAVTKPLPSFSFQGLGFLPNATYSTANAISADGKVVVGNSGLGGNCGQAFRWTAGAMTGLGFPGEGSCSYADGTNSDGTVIAGISNNAGAQAPVIWTNGTSTVLLQNYNCCGSPPPPCGPGALGVNADAQGVSISVLVGSDGGGNPGCGPGIPVAWVNGTEVAIFGWNTSPSGEARGANADGSVVVGRKAVSCSAGSCQEAFRGATVLGDLGGGYSEAYATNPDGSVVVGTAAVNNTDSQPFRWTAATGLVGLCPAAVYATAFAVSADGAVVVGQTGNGGQAFRWTASTGCQSIQDLLIAHGASLNGWTLTEATGVSADGTTIVGNANSPRGEQAWIAHLPLPAPPGPLGGPGTDQIR